MSFSLAWCLGPSEEDSDISGFPFWESFGGPSAATGVPGRPDAMPGVSAPGPERSSGLCVLPDAGVPMWIWAITISPISRWSMGACGPVGRYLRGWRASYGVQSKQCQKPAWGICAIVFFHFFLAMMRSLHPSGARNRRLVQMCWRMIIVGSIITTYVWVQLISQSSPPTLLLHY